jgi:hypothetical protein
MAMYVFQELSPKVFYFTYCLQEIGNYIQFIEETEDDSKTNRSLIGKWSHKESYSEKNISSDLSGQNDVVDTRSLFVINNLKATFHHCFTQYKLYNNIEEPVNLNTDYSIRKYYENFEDSDLPHGKYTAKMYINCSYDGGEIEIPNSNKKIKPEAGSMLIYPSDYNIKSLPGVNNSRYVATGYWV